MRSFLRRLLLGSLVALLVVAAALGALGWWAWETLHRPVEPPGGEARVAVEPGLGATAILERLEETGVIRDALLARLYLEYYLDRPALQAGEFAFTGPLTTPEALDRLIRGEVVTYPVTVIEGQTLEETAAVLALEGLGDRSRLLALMGDPAPIADLDPEAEDLEGYLFPDTYHFPRATPEEEIVETLVETFRRRFREEVRPLLEARERQMEIAAGKSTDPGKEAPELPTVREVVTLASVVEKEARLDQERPVIAGVYQNRLERGIALYADPTVIYALKRLGRWDGNLRRDDLQIDSPYNTYRYPGLPPGPIASPGLASLQAAAAPADVPYLYFVSRNDGSHVFATTLREHNRNVERWQRRYWRERWAEERGREKEEEEDGR